MTETCIVVGAGHAAGQAVASLRQGGFDGKILLIGDEPYIPYQRPPLSKAFLAGELELERLYFRPADFYSDAAVELRLGVRVTRIDRAARAVVLSDGETLPYDKLLLTIGSRVRELAVPGADLDGVFYLRKIDDVKGIRERFAPGRRLVIAGGGYIGLEVAAVAVEQGLRVTVLEMAPRVMARVVAPQVSDFYAAVHRAAGVDIRNGVRVMAFEGEDRVERVLSSDGASFDADLVVVGVGILPNDELARSAGLDCDNGIVVDEYARTSDPTIFAAGDCTDHPNALLGRRLRLESVHNAVEQAKTAAASICGNLKSYAQVPWFWSDQYDLKLQIAGLSGDHDQTVMRGDPRDRAFALFYLRDGVLIAVDAINRSGEFMGSKKLIAEKARVPTDRLADPSISMRNLL